MLEFVEAFLSSVSSIISALGYWGISIGMLLESACIPIPSELVLPLAGNMAAKGVVGLLRANIAVALGSMIGSLIAYGVGYNGGRSFILKYGKYFFVSEKHFYQAEKTFRKYGSAAVFFGRLLPVIRTFISLPAGIARMSLKKFVLYSICGMLPWNFILIYLGYRFGQKYDEVISPIFHKFEYLVIGCILFGVLFLASKHIFAANGKHDRV